MPAKKRVLENRAVSAVESLLITGAAILVAAVVISAMTGAISNAEIKVSDSNSVVNNSFNNLSNMQNTVCADPSCGTEPDLAAAAAGQPPADGGLNEGGTNLADGEGGETNQIAPAPKNPIYYFEFESNGINSVNNTQVLNPTNVSYGGGFFGQSAIFNKNSRYNLLTYVSGGTINLNDLSYFEFNDANIGNFDDSNFTISFFAKVGKGVTEIIFTKTNCVPTTSAGCNCGSPHLRIGVIAGYPFASIRDDTSNISIDCYNAYDNCQIEGKPINMDDGNFHNWTIVKSPDKFVFYKNGRFVGQSGSTRLPRINTNGAMSIGYASCNKAYDSWGTLRSFQAFTGELDDLKIFNAALSANEVLEQYNDAILKINQEELNRVFNASEITLGDGTEQNPYMIYNCSQLNEMRNYSSGVQNFRLGRDINCSDTVNWNRVSPNFTRGFEPINGEDGAGFKGNLDGNGHQIIGLYINRHTSLEDQSRPAGLFETLEGSVKKLRIVDANIHGVNSVGILAGQMYSGTSPPSQEIFTSGTVIGRQSVGGIVGSFSGNMEDVYSNANVRIGTCFGKGSIYFGGIAGEVTANGRLQRAYFGGTYQGDDYAGGISGYAEESNVNDVFSAGSPDGNDYIKLDPHAPPCAGTFTAGEKSVGLLFGHNKPYGDTGYYSVIDNNQSMGFYYVSKCIGTCAGSKCPAECSVYTDISNFYNSNTEPIKTFLNTGKWEICEGNSLPHFTWEEKVC